MASHSIRLSLRSNNPRRRLERASTRRYNLSMMWGLLHWFISLVEFVIVMAIILVAGLMIAMAAFWVLSRFLGKLTSAPVEPDPDEYEMDESIPDALVSDPPNDAAAA